MKTTKSRLVATLVFASAVLFTQCKKDDPQPIATTPDKTYALAALNNSGVSGTVTFHKQDATTTLITVQLTGTKAGDSHPAHIHAGKAADGGPIVLDFTPIDGATGMSTTTVTKMNDGTAITFEQLAAFNGHVNIHKSAAEIQIMIAQGNIGVNATPTPDPGPIGGYGNGGY